MSITHRRINESCQAPKYEKIKTISVNLVIYKLLFEYLTTADIIADTCYYLLPSTIMLIELSSPVWIFDCQIIFKYKRTRYSSGLKLGLRPGNERRHNNVPYQWLGANLGSALLLILCCHRTCWSTRPSSSGLPGVPCKSHRTHCPGFSDCSAGTPLSLLPGPTPVAGFSRRPYSPCGTGPTGRSSRTGTPGPSIRTYRSRGTSSTGGSNHTCVAMMRGEMGYYDVTIKRWDAGIPLYSIVFNDWKVVWVTNMFVQTHRVTSRSCIIRYYLRDSKGMRYV